MTGSMKTPEETGRATDGDGVRASRVRHDGDDTMNAFRKILVPTDFSPHAMEAFRMDQDLAKVARVEEPPNDPHSKRTRTPGLLNPRTRS